ncbi:MAG: helix-turn-helix domain-containing protein [Ruminococcus sp.]|nr:helix-turn-helix domain-containing protein [Ruminococcus sp.]
MSEMLIEEIEQINRNYLTPAEVSSALGISISTFYRNYEKMKFPIIRVGKKIHIPKEAFLNFLRYGKTVDY